MPDLLILQDNSQEGIVDVNAVVVVDEAQSSKFVHEEINPGPGCADHLGQRLLG